MLEFYVVGDYPRKKIEKKEKDKNTQRSDIEHYTTTWRALQSFNQKPGDLVPRHGHHVSRHERETVEI